MTAEHRAIAVPSVTTSLVAFGLPCAVSQRIDCDPKGFDNISRFSDVSPQGSPLEQPISRNNVGVVRTWQLVECPTERPRRERWGRNTLRIQYGFSGDDSPAVEVAANWFGYRELVALRWGIVTPTFKYRIDMASFYSCRTCSTSPRGSGERLRALLGEWGASPDGWRCAAFGPQGKS